MNDIFAKLQAGYACVCLCGHATLLISTHTRSTPFLMVNDTVCVNQHPLGQPTPFWSTNTLLVNRVAAIAGAAVEHNKFCVSVHFRNCRPDDVDSVYAAVETVLRDFPDLQMSRGRKVLEVKPTVDWDKGTALVHLLKALHLDDPQHVLAIYIGDDRTDEDAFRELASLRIGFGILVSSKVWIVHCNTAVGVVNTR